MPKILTEKVLVATMRLFLVGKSPQYDAVRTLLVQADYSPKSVTAAIALALARYDGSVGRMHCLRDIDALAFAISLAFAHPPHKRLAERVVLTAAQAGFHGRFPELPIRVLKRNPSEVEVCALVTAYVGDTATQSTDTEERLRKLATDNLPRERAKMEYARIDAFLRDWNNHVDL